MTKRRAHRATGKPKGRPQLEVANPAKLGQLQGALSVVGTVDGAAKAVGINRRTVKEMLKRNPGLFAPAQKELARKFLVASETLLEQGLAGRNKIGPAQAITMAAISADKFVALTNQGIPSVAVTVNIAQALQDNLDLRRRLLAAPAVEVTSTPAPPVAVEPVNNGQSDVSATAPTVVH